jgi:N-acetylmuramic acid 6-phosphate etherase
VPNSNADTTTESRDPRFEDIDSWSTPDAVEAMLQGQIEAVEAIKSQQTAIAKAAEAAAERLMRGGRLVYVGAGTSGRVAVQDGVELGPTFGWPAHLLVYLMAGGTGALMHSVEGAEDDGLRAEIEIAENGIAENDVVIGVAASGRTPYTVCAIKAARARGAMTIAIANNADTPLLTSAEHAIFINTGSEVIAGSTRMKAGTAQKAVLNILSTAIMLRRGRVYQGQMVDMIISNDKLLHRAQKMVATIARCDEATAVIALEGADRDIKKAVLMAIGHTPEMADAKLAANSGNLRRAIAAIKPSPE